MPTSKIVFLFIPFKTPLFFATTYVNALDKPKSNNDAEPISAQYIEMNPKRCIPNFSINMGIKKNAKKERYTVPCKIEYQMKFLH